jgi:DeoR family transcriptional regulator, fructose operon transcriptional repressor
MTERTKTEETVAADAVEAADYALPARRRSELLKLAKARGAITVVEIAQSFGVSADTARRDLDYLESRGLLTRTHGGAVPVDGFVDRDVPLAARLNSRAAEKMRIARAAAGLIVDGETLLVNGGSTTRAFAAELGARRNLTVVTNNLGVPASLAPNAARAVYLLGGHVRQELQVTIGAVGFADAGPISADTAVIGVGGISSRGLSTTLLEEAAMIRAMMDSARRVIVVADAAKFGASVFAHIAPLERVDLLVTDARPPSHLASDMADAGVEIVVAE